MKIAFIGPSYPFRGGIAQFAQNMAHKLLKDGHTIKMYTFIHQYPAILFPGSEQFDNTKQAYSLPTERILTPYNPITWLTSIKTINHWKPDIVIISYWLPIMAPAFGFITRYLKNTKRIYLIHNLDFHEKWIMAKQLTRYALQSGDGFITLSESTASLLPRLVDKSMLTKVLKLFHPVYEQDDSEKQVSPDTTHKMLFFGFIKHYKGLDILLKAMPLVYAKIPDIKLIIAGDVYGNKQEWLDLIETLKLNNIVEPYFQYIPDEMLKKLFTECDVCVLPYRTATQSGVAQMAFSHQMPVIATDVGGIKEVVINKTTGLLVKSESPQAIADAIIEFYTEGYSQTMRNEIRQQNMRYSWANFTAKVMEFLA